MKNIYIAVLRENGNSKDEYIIGYFQNSGRMDTIRATNENDFLTKIKTNFKSEKIVFHSKNIPYFKNLLSPKPEILSEDKLADIIRSYNKVEYQVSRSP